MGNILKSTNTNYSYPEPLRYDPNRKKVFEIVKAHGRKQLFIYSTIPSYKLERESMTPYLNLKTRNM